MTYEATDNMRDFCAIVWESIGPDAIFPDTHGMPGIVSQCEVATKIYDAIINSDDDAELGALIRAYARPYLCKALPAIGLGSEQIRLINASMNLMQKTKDKNKE